MQITTEWILRILGIGIGATLVMDIWAQLLKHVFGIASLNWAMVGRWVGHFPQGRFSHPSIAAASPVPGEKVLGWITHYTSGILLATILVNLAGLNWARQPSPAPAIAFGIVSVALPFLLMQPGMGAGIAASKTPQPAQARLRSLMTHTVFGIGLYLAAWLTAQIR
ncbi:MAG: DUF2938 domain-containing protein [Burkholderiales bacterium]|nr:DUF2938 domain-containing protein [Burkholderiales bacterium]